MGSSRWCTAVAVAVVAAAKDSSLVRAFVRAFVCSFFRFQDEAERVAELVGRVPTVRGTQGGTGAVYGKATHILHAIDTCFEGLCDMTVVDLGCGAGALGVGAAILGA